MKKLRWGIISTAGIAQQSLIPALQQSDCAEVVAVASRNIAKAEDFARQNNIPKAYASYEELLAANDIDVIYNPLPNNLHVPVSIQAIEAGKHVLCEKPLGMNEEDIKPLLLAAKNHPELVVMEAFMYRFHPQWIRVKELIKSNVLGKINAVDSSFSYYNVDANNVRHKENVGGGGLLDIGCYCISASRFIFDKEPKRVIGTLDIDPNFKVDRHATGILDFAPGLANFVISTQSETSQHVKIVGEQGTLIIENPFYQGAKTSRLLLTINGEQQVIDCGSCNQYIAQVNAFSNAVFSQTAAPTPLSDAQANMKVIDAIFKSSELDSWINIG